MKDDAYSLLFLKEKCKGIPFQIWAYDMIQNEIELLYATDSMQRKEPSFHRKREREEYYQMIKHEEMVEVIYFFSDDYQVIVQIFHDQEILLENEIIYLYHFFSLMRVEQKVQTKEIELNNLVDSIRAISSSLNLEQVLRKIMQNALKIIPATDAGYLMIYDEEVGRLIPKAPIGFNDEIYKFKVRIGESITGKVFEDGRGRIYNSAEAIYQEMDSYQVSIENYTHITSAAKTPEAAVCVAVSIDKVRIGVMIIHQWRRKKVMTDYDLKLLEGFAEQAAVAIQNAQYYADATKKIAVITELSEELQEKNNQLQKRQFIHESLTGISLKNKGFETIIYEFNEMIELPVSFYNALENSYHFAEGEREIPLSTQELRNIFSKSGQAIYLPELYLYPIYNGTIFLGCIIVHTNRAISTSDQMILEQGSPFLVLELIKKQTVAEHFYRKTHEQFQALIHYQSEQELLKAGTEMGFPQSSYWFVAIAEIPEYTDLQMLEIQVYQLTTEIKHTLRTVKKIVYGYQSKVILLVSLASPEQFSSIRKKLQYIQEDWHQNNSIYFRLGVSTIYKGLKSIKKCYDEAEKTLSYLTSCNRLELLRYDEIGLNKLFIHQESTEIEQFVQDVFEPLWTNEEHHKELEDTLLTYIEANRSASQAAKNLHIHTNTLYQRLRKLEEILQLRLNNPEDILKIQLACHLRTTYTTTKHNEL